MAVTVTPNLQLSPNEDLSQPSLDDDNVVHNSFNFTGVPFTGSTTAPVDTPSFQEYTLSGGAATIDLAALLTLLAPGGVDATGKKVQMGVILNPAGNDAVTVSPGASNPYPLFGTGNDVEIPGHATYDNALYFVFPEGLADVAGGAKEIDLAGTAADVVKIGLICG